MRWLLLVALGSLLGCSHRYSYAPVRTTSAEIGGSPAAVYTLPDGELRVAAFGIAKLRPEGIEDSTLPAVTVSLIVWNQTDQLWRVDGSAQRMSLAGHPDVAATTLLVTRPPITPIEPWATRRIDLYFPLPAGLAHAREIPAFEIAWRIQAGDVTYSNITSFERFTVEPAAPPLRDIREPQPMLPGNEAPQRHPGLP